MYVHVYINKYKNFVEFVKPDMYVYKIYNICSKRIKSGKIMGFIIFLNAAPPSGLISFISLCNEKV